MSTTPPPPPRPDADAAPLDPALARRLERLGLAEHKDQWTERYVLCQRLVEPSESDPRQEFEATSRFIRDLVAHRWVSTRRAREQSTPKRIHYLSMEFLLGRSLRNNMMNLAAEPLVRHALQQQHWNLDALIEEERTPASATAASAGWPRASSTRSRRCSIPPSVTACATHTASSARPSATARRSSSPTTGCAAGTLGRFRARSGVTRCRSTPNSSCTAPS
jgi:hypothetical protein